MANPINPRLSGEELLELILRENPRLTRETVLAVAASARFDLLELQRNPNSPPAKKKNLLAQRGSSRPA